MKKFIVSMIALAAIAFSASAANYTISEADVDSMIEEAVEVSPVALEASLEAPASAAAASSMIGGMGSEPIIAFLLAVIPVTGWLAIHRIYMGTSILAVVLNIVTGAGFGVVYVCDWVFLLIGALDGGIGEYCNNPHWWMVLNML